MITGGIGIAASTNRPLLPKGGELLTLLDLVISNHKIV